ncbi:MAG: DNA cytosine methyltransferase [Candidatus Accumulibacter cognatus]|uniref:DNA (cytosine-5-)-methyltransferase n=1 Tax=Candidatus Accumulibacter cognatus TaxID=2954383 RepID=A0A7D5NCK9_9PROT|nr:MAG: DNA cytosine methyltransferase [Candidatus Accumulibacter cognatus]
MNELALFAGAGGGILGGHLLGWRTVCAVEWEPYAASVLAQRQNDGLLPAFPIWDDVCTFDGRPWRGVVDVVSGGFPCQDISAAGKGAGLDGERSGLWREMARIVGEVRPQFVFVENSPLLVGRGLVRVLADLAEMGFDARWGVVGAGHLGGWHLRERCWIVASDHRKERIQGGGEESFSRERGIPWCQDVRRLEDLQGRSDLPDPLIRGIRNGVAAYVDRISAIGNGQVPLVAATAWRILTHNVFCASLPPWPRLYAAAAINCPLLKNLPA